MFLARASAALLLAALIGCATDNPVGPGGTDQLTNEHTFTVDPNDPAALTSVSGYVYGKVAGDPKLAGVVVRVLFAPTGGDTLNSISGNVTTDAEGRFSVGSIPAGSLYLIANESPRAGSAGANWSSCLSGLITSTGVSSAITVGLGVDPTDGVPPDTLPTPHDGSTLSFMPGNPSALTSISGDVHGIIAGGPALAGILVHVVLAVSAGDSAATLSGDVTTDADGHFSVTAIPSGSVTLTANLAPAPGSPGAAWGSAQPAPFASTGVSSIITVHLGLAGSSATSASGIRFLLDSLPTDTLPGDSVPSDTLPPSHGRGHGHGKPPRDTIPNGHPH